MNNMGTEQSRNVFQSDIGPIAQVRAGMAVVDVNGEHLGTVERVQMGNPQAATVQGNVDQPSSFVADVAAAIFGDSVDVPEPKRSQLLRYGFLRVDGSGLRDTDRVAANEAILGVVDATVWLRVSKDALIAEQA